MRRPLFFVLLLATACPVTPTSDGGAGGGTATGGGGMTGGGAATGGGTATGGGGATGGGSGGGASSVREARDVISGSARVTGPNVLMDVQVGHALARTPASAAGTVVQPVSATQP